MKHNHHIDFFSSPNSKFIGFSDSIFFCYLQSVNPKKISVITTLFTMMKLCKKKNLIENHLLALCMNLLCLLDKISFKKNYKSVKNHLHTVRNTMMKLSKKIPKWSHLIFQKICSIQDLNFLSSIKKTME